MTVGSRSSLRDSRGTVVLARDYREAPATNGAAISNGNHSPDALVRKLPGHARGPTLDTMPESDAYSSVTETSTLWCEICETNGHDILTCTNMFGPQQGGQQQQQQQQQTNNTNGSPRTGKDVVRAAVKNMANGVSSSGDHHAKTTHAHAAPPPTHSPEVKMTTPTSVPADVKILPNPMESGPVAGKESGVVDADKWCALCERDGHDSVDCPFEDAF